MTVTEQIQDYFSTQPESKRADLQELHLMLLELLPEGKLWFLDGKDEKGKTVSNPKVGYGLQTLKYADGTSKEFYQIGISANTTGISVYILGLEDKGYLAETYGKRIGKASVTGYCIKFRRLNDVNVDVLLAAIRDGLERTSNQHGAAARNLGVHSILRDRWSPTTWDLEWEIPQDQVDLLLEAARWAPSAGNSQPWSFIVARRGDENHRRLVGHLARSSSSWAPQASLLVVNLCHRFVEGTDWEFSEFAMYDLGQAVAHLTVQAAALGLAVHQFAAFDHEAVKREFEVPDDWQVATMSAIGRVPEGVAPHGQRTFSGQTLARDRLSIASIQWDPHRGEQ